MTLKNVLPILALAAGMMAGCAPPEEGKSYADKATEDILVVSPTAKKIAEDGTASFTFSLSIIFPNGKAVDFENNQATLSFSATGGSVSPSSATTDAKGQVTVTFSTSDAQSFEGGTVTGVVKKVEGKELFQQGNLATATAQVLPLNAPDPNQPIQKAEALRDNTYSIQVKGGDATISNLTQEYSQWYLTKSKMDRTKEAIRVSIDDDDPEQSTMGGGFLEIPAELANKLSTINQEFVAKYPWFHADVFTMRTGKELNANISAGSGETPVGNVKLDGSSQIQIKEKSGTKAFTGEYQLLFVIEFTVAGQDYVIAGNATVNHYQPELYSFAFNNYPDWMKTNTSAILEVDWTDGAEFDVNKVKLVNQTKGGVGSTDRDEGYFTWNAATQELTAVKSADNEKVYLIFSYEGTELRSGIQIAVGPGWNYTSFSISPSFLVVDQGYFHFDYQKFTVDDWTPRDAYYYFPYHSIELDPASDYYSKLYYDSDDQDVSFSNIPNGDFNIIFRCKSNHDVTRTVPVKMVEKKVKSFQIKPESGATVGYNMGLELSVETNPEDAYWDWSYVELDPAYEENFHFQGHGGRDDHPKLFVNTSHDPAVMGTQVMFRLKYDHSKYCFIYVTMD
ncbi:MAG: Ig-like domain-containing protein [Bacteroidales bacterium]|nr:Ig-like domain-containing protein [Bacteroidales bacterium]